MKNVTEIIKEYLFVKGINQTKLAEDLKISKSNLNQRLKKNDMPVSTVIEISKILNYDFLAEISKQLPKNVQNKQITESQLEYAIKQFIEKNYPKIK